MSIIFVTGNHPRNYHMARSVASTGKLSAIVVQDRGRHIPTPPDNLCLEFQEIYKLHFDKRRLSELKFFGDDSNFEDLCGDVRYVTDNEEMNLACIELVGSIGPSMLLTYNAGIVDDEVLSIVSGFAWNIHPGFVPWYRGAATHFWANYMLEPQKTGVTLHELTSFVDGGAIIHQSVAPLVEGDGLHDVACRALLEFSEELPQILSYALSGGEVVKKDQNNIGRTWLKRDWRPEHLLFIYKLWGDRIVDAYLEGRIRGDLPICFRGNFQEGL